MSQEKYKKYKMCTILKLSIYIVGLDPCYRSECSHGYNFMDLFCNYLPVKIRKVDHLHQVEGVRDRGDLSLALTVYSAGASFVKRA